MAGRLGREGSGVVAEWGSGAARGIVDGDAAVAVAALLLGLAAAGLGERRSGGMGKK